MNNIMMNVSMTKAILDGCKVQTRRVFKHKGVKISGISQNTITCYDDYATEKEFTINDFTKEYSKYQIGETIWVREPAKILGNHKQFGGIYERTCDFKYLADDKEIKDFEIPRRIAANHINNFLYPEKYNSWLVHNKGIPNGCIKEMARIFLKITNVRVERLNDISVDDICDEGYKYPENEYGDAECRCETQDEYVPCDNCFNAFQWWINLWNRTAPKAGQKQRRKEYVKGDKDALVTGYRWEDNPYVFVYEFERVDGLTKRVRDLKTYDAPPFRTLLGEQPSGSGYYYVIWESGDEPEKVYLWDCREICSEDGEPLWNWGWDDSDDPESIGLDIEQPWHIQWCLVDEFERVER